MKAAALSFVLLLTLPSRAFGCDDIADLTDRSTIDTFLTAIQLAFREGNYNEWVLTAQEQLRQIDPQLVGPRYELPLTPSEVWVRN